MSVAPDFGAERVVAPAVAAQAPLIDWRKHVARLRASAYASARGREAMCRVSRLERIGAAYDFARMIPAVPPVSEAERQINALRADLMWKAELAWRQFNYEGILWC